MTTDVSDHPKLRPYWLRPGAIIVAIGLHMTALLVVTVPRPALPSTDDNLEITIAQGTPEVEQPPEPPAPAQPPDPPPPVQPPQPPPPDPTPPDPQPVPPPPDPTPPQAQPDDPLPPDPIPPVETEAPKREVADAPAIPLRKPKPKPKPKPHPQVVQPVQDAPPPPPSSPPPPPSEAKQTGEQQAHDEAMHVRATYAGKVLAAIRSHQTPASSSGSVIVSFAITAAGDMTNVAIVRSSGHHELDSIALRMVRAARPGPPPDGSFSGSTTINFVED
ncbi:MAG TPA: TonB family protein [Rhodopila sp.]